MDRIKVASCTMSYLAPLVVLVGCAPMKPQPFRSFFLAPAPAAKAAVVVAPAPPEIEPRVELRTATPPTAIEQPGARRAEALTRRADWHFQLGLKHYQEGDEAGARREFDRAIDVLLAAPDDAAVRAAVDKRLDELVSAIHRLDLAGLGSGETSEPGFEKSPLEQIPQLTFPIDPKLKNKVLDEVRATGSQLPLDVNDAVLSYVHYFSSERGRRILVMGLRRGGRYRPLIQRVLDEEGIPQELAYLAQAESGFMPRAVSRKRATGMWQFMLSRGRQYGLSQTPYSDGRLDPEGATRAAARHLRDLYQHYGDWYLAMAAYNCGPGRVDRAVERTGYADFWELRRRGVLPKETANYIPIILAMTIMAKNPHEYGLEDLDIDPALEYDTVEITAPTSLVLVADLAECPVSQLQDLNPALLKNMVPAAWMLRVPKNTGVELMSMLEIIPPEKRASWRGHRIGDGDTLAAIARRYRVAESLIAAANREMDGTLSPGELLVIPAAAPAVAKAKPVSKRAASSSHHRTRSVAQRKAPARRHARLVASRPRVSGSTGK